MSHVVKPRPQAIETDALITDPLRMMRLLVRVSTENRDARRTGLTAFLRYCQDHGISAANAERADGDVDAPADGAPLHPRSLLPLWGERTWFVVDGAPAAVGALNAQPWVLESEYVLSGSVARRGAGATKKK